MPRILEDIHPALWFTYVHLHNAAAPVVTQRVKFHADLRLEKVAHLTNHIFNQGYLAPRLRSCVSWQGVCGKKIQEHASVQELLSWGEGASEEKAIRLIIGKSLHRAIRTFLTAFVDESVQSSHHQAHHVPVISCPSTPSTPCTSHSTIYC